MSKTRLSPVTVTLLIGSTAVCLPVILMIAFWPDALVDLIVKTGVAERENIAEKVNQLFVDILLAYVISVFLIMADAMCRATYHRSLPGALFFDNPDGDRSRRFQIASLVASILGCVLILDYFAMGRTQEQWLYMEDGPIENLTALSFAVAGIVMLWTIVRSLTGRSKPIPRVKLVAGGLFGLALLLVAMEEISWGQRIFGIETPELLTEVNTQQEFNVHNIFTDYFKYAYFVIAMILFGINWISFRFWITTPDHPSRQWLPAETLLILSAQILCFSFHLMFNELIEPIAAMFVLLFAWQTCAPYWNPEGMKSESVETLNPGQEALS